MASPVERGAVDAPLEPHWAPRPELAPAGSLERELETAIGLVWGHLACHQFGQAATLARGCLDVWPEQPLLLLLGAHAANELGEPVTPQVRALLRQPPYAALAALVLRRAAGVVDAEGEVA